VRALGVSGLPKGLNNKAKAKNGQYQLNETRPSRPLRPAPSALLRVQIAAFMFCILWGGLCMFYGFKCARNAVGSGFMPGWTAIAIGAACACYGIVELIDRYG
jgi:hypothetical protein